MRIMAYGEEHTVGAICDACPEGYPLPCKCEGYIHAEVLEFGRDDKPIYQHSCDKCGGGVQGACLTEVRD